MKDTLKNGASVLFVTAIGVGWFYHIIWTLDNWENITMLTKIICIFILLAGPLGGVVGFLQLLIDLWAYFT